MPRGTTVRTLECPVEECNTKIYNNRIMCANHWDLVPFSLRSRMLNLMKKEKISDPTNTEHVVFRALLHTALGIIATQTQGRKY